MNLGILWLIAVVVFAVLEMLTYQLVSIWFAGGAIGGLIAYALGADFTVQLVVFLVLAALLLIATRPFVKKMRNGSILKTNVDSLVGREAMITDAICNVENHGEAKVDGMVWTARSCSGEPIPVGEVVVVDRVEGVKLMVKKPSEKKGEQK
jgi:membrane protein implicated in regulation of membrane protease activity